MSTLVTKQAYYRPLELVAKGLTTQYIYTGIWANEKAVIFLYRKKGGSHKINVDADGNCFELQGKQYVSISREQAILVMQPKGFKLLATGLTTTVFTASGREVSVKYAIVNADEIITSHDTNLNPDKRYPKELQPRDRTRAASETQVAKITNQLRPQFLCDSMEASQGAPIIGRDGFVESGNARTIAIKRVYSTNGNGRQAMAYKDYLLSQAKRLQLSESIIKMTSKPVLVRVRQTELDRVQFCAECNQSEVAKMSPVEQALSDARLMDNAMMSKFYPTDDGNILTAANRQWFIPQFLGKVVGAEIAAYLDPDGLLNVEGIRRIRNAVFAKAYSDSYEGGIILQRVVEDPTNNFNHIANALLKQAGRFAQLKADIEAGNKYPLDISGDIVAAVKKLSDLRINGTKVNDFLNQHNLFGDELNSLQKEILQLMDANARSGKKINEILDGYLTACEQSAHPKQVSFMDGSVTTKEILFTQVVKRGVSEEYNFSLFEREAA